MPTATVTRPPQVQRRHVKEFVTFGLVGASGVIVNLLVVIVLKRITGMDDEQVRQALFPLGLGGKSFRVYHLFAIVAFCVANLWNFELNRRFTFANGHDSRGRRVARFFVVGAGAQALGLVIMSALMSPSSVIGLPRSVFDGSSGLRSPLYWAQLIQVICTTPISFVLQKLWTFGARERDDAGPTGPTGPTEPTEPTEPR